MDINLSVIVHKLLLLSTLKFTSSACNYVADMLCQYIIDISE